MIWNVHDAPGTNDTGAWDVSSRCKHMVCEILMIHSFVNQWNLSWPQDTSRNAGLYFTLSAGAIQLMMRNVPTSGLDLDLEKVNTVGLGKGKNTNKCSWELSMWSMRSHERKGLHDQRHFRQNRICARMQKRFWEAPTKIRKIAYHKFDM